MESSNLLVDQQLCFSCCIFLTFQAFSIDVFIRILYNYRPPIRPVECLLHCIVSVDVTTILVMYHFNQMFDVVFCDTYFTFSMVCFHKVNFIFLFNLLLSDFFYGSNTSLLVFSNLFWLNHFSVELIKYHLFVCKLNIALYNFKCRGLQWATKMIFVLSFLAFLHLFDVFYEVLKKLQYPIL